MNPSLEEKVCLITGGSSGIGLASALGLAELGATVVLVGRNRDRGAAAVERICEDVGRAAAHFLAADLSVQSEVRRLAQEFQARFPRLDVLINNAGGFFHKRQQSADGIEMTWALDVLGPFLLTKLLLPTLRASAPTRVLFVSSVMQKVGRLHFADLEGERRYNRIRAYSQAKLAVVLLAYEFARRMDATGVSANALDPGFVATDVISGNGSVPWRAFQAVANLLAVTPQEGARTGIFLASSPDVAETTGQYFKAGKAVPSAPASYDRETARRLWRVCSEMTGAG